MPSFLEYFSHVFTVCAYAHTCTEIEEQPVGTGSLLARVGSGTDPGLPGLLANPLPTKSSCCSQVSLQGNSMTKRNPHLNYDVLLYYVSFYLCKVWACWINYKGSVGKSLPVIQLKDHVTLGSIIQNPTRVHNLEMKIWLCEKLF